MTYSNLATYYRLSPNRSIRRSSVIDTVTVHCYVGQVTARRGVDGFADPEAGASSNYVIGHDGSIGCSVPEEYRAWTTGGTDADGNPIRVNGISGADNDHRAITIEVASDNYDPYAITEEAMAALIRLLTDICTRRGIKQLLWKADKTLVGRTDIQNMTVHRWFARKSCPGDYIYERLGAIAEKVTKCLNLEIKEDIDVYNRIDECPSYAQDVVRRMVDAGYIGGTGTGEKDDDGRPADLALSLDMVRMFVILDRAGALNI